MTDIKVGHTWIHNSTSGKYAYMCMCIHKNTYSSLPSTMWGSSNSLPSHLVTKPLDSCCLVKNKSNSLELDSLCKPGIDTESLVKWISKNGYYKNK